MTTFIKHESCPRCGSRDNLGRYSDGSAWCFGCHYYEPSTTAPWINQDEKENYTLACVGSTSFPVCAVQWLSKYQINVGTVLGAGLRWDSGREQLVFPFYDREGKLVCTQARNFNPDRASKAKYYNVGEKESHFTIYGKGDVLVLTEDALSALKISPITAAMPLLGTHISKHKLMALKASYSSLIVWLDADKFKEAVTIAQQAKWIGFNARAIYSDLDPKEYSVEELKERMS